MEDFIKPFYPVPITRDQVTPDWLQAILSPYIYTTVTSFQWQGPANNGHGVMSTIERILVETETGEQLSLIMKTLPPEDSPLRDITIENGFAQRELEMYRNLFPKWEKFQDERNVPDKYRFRVPKCYYAASTGSPSDKDNYHQIIILEDLFDSGWEEQEGNNNHQKSWKEAKPCIHWLAMFHAVGLAYAKEQGIKDYSQTFPFLDHKLEETEDVLEQFMDSGFQFVDDFIREQEEQDYAAHMGLIETLGILRRNVVKSLKFLNPNESGNEGVVCHYDMHQYNVMFGNNGKSAMFYDFQACMYTMPMKDLSFFLLQNCEESLLTFHQLDTKVLPYYCYKLHEALSAMGATTVTRSYGVPEIKREFREVAYLSVLHVISGAPNYLGTDKERQRFYRVMKMMFKDGLLHGHLGHEEE